MVHGRLELDSVVEEFFGHGDSNFLEIGPGVDHHMHEMGPFVHVQSYHISGMNEEVIFVWLLMMFRLILLFIRSFPITNSSLNIISLIFH